MYLDTIASIKEYQHQYQRRFVLEALTAIPSLTNHDLAKLAGKIKAEQFARKVGEYDGQ